MPKKTKSEPTTPATLTIEALFMGDTANYHKYQVADGEATGNLYITKGIDPVPGRIVAELITQGDDRWMPAAKSLLANARPGSKGHAKLAAVIESAPGGKG